MRKTLAGLALLGTVAVAPPAGAQEHLDTSGIVVKKAIADRMTAEQLAAYKQLLARRKAAGAFDRAPGGRGRTPGDACTAIGYDVGTLPFGPAADSTAGAADNYDLPPDSEAPTCTASSACTGDGLPLSLPRGTIYTGTGTAPDRAWRIKTDANCALTIDAAPTAAWDLALIVYQATCSSLLSDCVCVDDTGGAGTAESVALSAQAGTDYFIVIDGYSSGGAPPGPSGPYTLQISGTGCSLVPVELQDFWVE